MCAIRATVVLAIMILKERVSAEQEWRTRNARGRRQGLMMSSRRLGVVDNRRGWFVYFAVAQAPSSPKQRQTVRRVQCGAYSAMRTVQAPMCVIRTVFSLHQFYEA